MPAGEASGGGGGVREGAPREAGGGGGGVREGGRGAQRGTRRCHWQAHRQRNYNNIEECIKPQTEILKQDRGMYQSSQTEKLKQDRGMYKTSQTDTKAI